MMAKKSAKCLSIGRNYLSDFTGNPKSLIKLSSYFQSSSNTNSKYLFDNINNPDDALQLLDKMLQTKKPMPRNRDYNKLFNIIVKMEHYSLVIIMFKKLSLSGFRVDDLTMTTVINCYCNVKEVDKGFAVLASMLKLGFAPDYVAISCLIKGLFLQENVVEAVELFEKLRRGELCEVDESCPYIYSLNRPTFERKCRYGFDDIKNLDESLTVFFEMLRSKPMPSVCNFNKLLNIIVKMEHYWQVIVMFKMLSVLGCLVNDYTMTTAINCYCKLKEVNLGFAVLASMLKNGYALDIVSVSCLIKGLFAESKVEKAFELFKKLIRDKWCEVNEFTISILLHGLCQSGKVSDALEQLGLLEKESYEVNVVAYTSVIDGLCKEMMVEEAMHLFSKMIERGISPSVVTYTTLIHGLCNCSLWDEAKKLTRQMVHNKVYPNIKTYSALVNAYCKERLIQNAENVVQIMIDRGIHPDLVTYTSLMNGYCLIGQLDKAKELLNLMEEKGLDPDLVSYGTMINGYCKHMKINYASKMFKEMAIKGLKPNTQIYNIMIQGLCQEGMFEEVKVLLVKMEKSGCFPNNITHYIIIRGCLKHYDKFDSLNLLRRISERNEELAVWTFSYVLKQMRGNDEDLGRKRLIQKIISNDNSS